LPKLTNPSWSAIPHVALGAVAVSLVALAQAAGIAAAVPNPDGRRANASGDFVAQGLANAAGTFFGALPTGGSLSRTGVAVSAGARTRWAGIFAGAWLIGVVLVFGSVAERIPMPVIGGLIIVIGIELVVGRVPDIVLVCKTAPLSTMAMVITFAATTQLPLQYAILIGAVISLLLYCVSATRHADLVALEPTGTGQWRFAPVPSTLPSNAVTVLHYESVGLFAEVPRLDERWPRTADARDAVIILSVRTLPDVPSSAVVKAIAKRARALGARGNKLMIVGVTPGLRRILDHSGLTEILGSENVVSAQPVVFGALDASYAQAKAWIAEHADGRTS
ncbi:MAG TPA: SulP family inorganic anion transporter, partial [Jatrophihabitantaceae bacterium]